MPDAHDVPAPTAYAVRRDPSPVAEALPPLGVVAAAARVHERAMALREQLGDLTDRLGIVLADDPSSPTLAEQATPTCPLAADLLATASILGELVERAATLRHRVAL